MKTIGFCTVFITDMNSPGKNTPNKCVSIDFADKAKFQPILSKAIAL